MGNQPSTLPSPQPRRRLDPFVRESYYGDADTLPSPGSGSEPNADPQEAPAPPNQYQSLRPLTGYFTPSTHSLVDESTVADESDTAEHEIRSKLKGEDTESQRRVHFEEPTESLSDGVYQLVNVKSGTVIDLSGGDSKSIIGFPGHQGLNQLWKFEPLGSGYSIRSVSSGSYLTIEDGLSDGIPVIASEFPVSWKVIECQEHEEMGCVRILWPTEKFTFDLANSGSAVPGTIVQLSEHSATEPSQLWRLEQVITEQPHIMEDKKAIERYEHTTVVPAKETVISSDSGNTTTITRTVTTVTTVTTVAKTDCGCSGLVRQR